MYERLDSIPGGHNVDDRIPESHQREYQTGRVVERKRHHFGVDKRVDSICRRRNLVLVNSDLSCNGRLLTHVIINETKKSRAHFKYEYAAAFASIAAFLFGG